jgi:hypothetical protein
MELHDELNQAEMMHDIQVLVNQISELEATMTPLIKKLNMACHNYREIWGANE